MQRPSSLIGTRSWLQLNRKAFSTPILHEPEIPSYNSQYPHHFNAYRHPKFHMFDFKLTEEAIAFGSAVTAYLIQLFTRKTLAN